MQVYEYITRILQGCNSFRKLLQIHAQSILQGLQNNPSVAEKLLNFCAVSTSGSLVHASLIFSHLANHRRTQNSWNCVIRGFSVKSPLYSLRLYNQMLSLGIAAPDIYTFSYALKASEGLKSLDKFLEIHACVIRKGFCSQPIVATNVLRCYCRNDLFEHARKVFDEMHKRDTVAWNAMISCYSQAGHHDEAIELYNKMKTEGNKIDSFTMVGVLSSCAHVGAINIGTQLHKTAKTKGLTQDDLFVGNALIDMFAKCGDVKRAISVFTQMKKRDVSTWNSVICGLGAHGFGKQSIFLFPQMIAQNINPNSITFLGLLLGCSHEGLVKEGETYFSKMKSHYNVPQESKHFGCMVDMYSRAGMFHKALTLIPQSSSPIDPVLWRTFLSACKTHKNLKMAKLAAANLLHLNAMSAGDCVLLAAAYADEGDTRGEARVRLFMNRQGMRTSPGWSWIEIGDKVHRFCVDDTRHPEIEMAMRKLEEILGELGFVGYEDSAGSVHSEKLAIAYGLAKDCEEIRILKNLRACDDCHTFTKLVSKAYNRNIVVRDCARFHHFVDGKCSCGDYW